MKLATLLIIALSHHGYWIAGQSATIALRPAVKGGLPDAALLWELKFDGVRLGEGKVALAANDKGADIRLAVPTARVRITLHWHYRLVARDGAKELETGDVPISIFPDDLVSGLGSRVGRSRLVVWDEPNGLPALLDVAKVPYSRISAAGQLQIATADVILVGQEVLKDSPFDQSPLLRLAENGASVMIFRQVGPSRLFGYSLTDREVPSSLDWQMNHPLFAGFSPQDMRSWIAESSSLRAVRLPADEPALVVAGYRREIGGGQSAPIDAVILSKSVGKGRIVLCQLHMEDWGTDPRSQILLTNSIDYLLTRPEPTPRPSERPATQPTQGKIFPLNQIFPGDKP